ncbi:MAG: glycoside hydrolase family 5 protein [Salinivirgaceae bacterium]|jgi:endoglucanase|nr:glycoside hydrolase family 5 protein [Salinivirgaceae bacterium]
MKKYFTKSWLILAIVAIFQFSNAQTAVEKYGQLSVDSAYIVDQNGEAVQLVGMSLFWSNWAGEYYNYSALKWLRDEWKCTLIRVPMGIVGNEEGAGYLDDPKTERAKMDTVIQAAIKLGLYVIVDWHSHNAHDQQKEAQTFFEDIAKTYGKYPNIMYELYNEPEKVSWDSVVKPYLNNVIPVIRKHDKNNIILCGSPTWSQDVDIVAKNPITGFDNIAYTVHYYAATHKQYLRDKIDVAMKNGIAIFISEFGVCNSAGDYPIDEPSAREWFDFLDKHKIGWANWSIHHKEEAASALKIGVNPAGGWTEDELSESGKIIYKELIKKSAENSDE